MIIDFPLLLLAGANLLLLNIGSFRDGLFGLRYELGWEKRHYVIWSQRDIPAILIILASLWINPTSWPVQIAIVLSHTFHRRFYALGESSVEKFRGPQTPPAWFDGLMKIYRKIIWWS